MNTDVRRTLPATAIPDGCLPWSTEQTRRWTRELPPGWIPVRWVGLSIFQLVWLMGALAALGLNWAGVPPYLAALAGLHLVWLPLRPEIVRVSAPVLALVTVAVRPEPVLPVLVGAFLLTAVSLTVSELRLRARRRQREAAVAAAGGVTAVLPDADQPLGRGRLLSGLGIALIVLVAAGVPVTAAIGMWDTSEGRRFVALAGLYATGLGVTALLSGVLGRRRAVALRAAPVPVLRVLVREDRRVDAEVYAADDVAGLRPLFTVATVRLDLEADRGEDGGTADDEAELDDFLEELDDKRPKPLREAVLYGAPYDGAEVVLVSAARKPGDPPVAERSTGPARPLPAVAVRWRLRVAKRQAAWTAADDERHRGLVAAALLTTETVPVRRWRAGALDRLSAFLMVLAGVFLCWMVFTDRDGDLWQQFVCFLGGLYGAFRIPVKLCWRITADRTGVWLNSLRGTTHIPWDDVRSVRRQVFELRLRWRGGESWAVSTFSWTWCQRRFGLTHPYDALAAELSAMQADPALRPTGDSEERERGRPLWPLGVPLAVLWVAGALVALVSSGGW
ncbi:hypothetical protein FNH09_04085 [Streptomyces adustus]|uniref:Uncharacterized protein n=1 Tax=Streptomyces adustus TaxID=1609272 RepID=A0A5N8V5T7_9ACTN|nr:hypothetical protein [Streptomyces adustus]MPY30517.1 hypothetical protein [Streptomyces adustus]